MPVRGAADECQCPAMQILHLGEQLASLPHSPVLSARCVCVSYPCLLLRR